MLGKRTTEHGASLACANCSGLAKEVDPAKKLEDGTYKLTGDTGSLRYMAPEVSLGKPYNDTVDTFSFAILCWQMLAELISM